MAYYNQRDYAHVAYPAPGYGAATLKTSGCGPVCASMVVEMFRGDSSFPPEQSAACAIKIGARVSGGTDLRKLGRSIAKDYGLSHATANGLPELRACLDAGGCAIANVSGNIGKIGLFSDGGHYIVVRGVRGDGRLIVWDPFYYTGKFSAAGRKGKVEVKHPDLYVGADDLHADTAGRSPRYYLFEEDGTVSVYEKLGDVPSSYRPTIRKLMESGALQGYKSAGDNLEDAVINVDETFCRVMTVLDRMGALEA